MLRHFLGDFTSLMPLQMPQLLNVTTMGEPQFYGNYVLLTFPLRDSYDLEEVIDIFEDDMGLITPYHHVPVGLEKSDRSIHAYSDPAFGRTFKMNVRTDADDKVNRIITAVHDSLELMYGDLCLDLKLRAGNGSFEYKKNQGDMLLDFM